MAVLTHDSMLTVAAISSTSMTPSSVGPSAIPSPPPMSSAGPHLNSWSGAAPQVSSSSSSVVASQGPSTSSLDASSVTSSTPSSTPSPVTSSDNSSASSAHASSAMPAISLISSSLTTCSTHSTEATTHEAVEHSAPPAYVTPLPGYTYNGPAPEYVSLSASVTASSTRHGPSSPAERFETGGIMGSQVATTTEPGISGHASAHPDSYGPNTSAPHDSTPLHTEFPADAALGRRSAPHDGHDGGMDKATKSANETQRKTSAAACRRDVKFSETWMLVVLSMMMLGALRR
ncbi:hypothetical protein CP533_1602 [Ophiocordyceps camponoti-saundersi (nom. inval.)]|nr:hypothetical protein CP533_1602 [Ophiocordyceps camponoti-saundersi (nom. inval.)]